VPRRGERGEQEFRKKLQSLGTLGGGAAESARKWEKRKGQGKEEEKHLRLVGGIKREKCKAESILPSEPKGPKKEEA